MIAEVPHWPADMPAAFTEVPRQPLLSLLLPKLYARGSEPMVIFDDGVELACSDFLEAASQLAAGLAPLVKPGDQVGLALGNRAEFLVAYYALLSLRAVAVLMGTSIGQAEAEYVVQDRGLRLAISEGAAADILDKANGGVVTVLRVDPEAVEPFGLQAYSRSGGTLENPDSTPEDIIGIGFTSGTTGLPKALAFDHNETLRYADIVLRTLPFSSTDRFLCPLHFHYGDPLWMLLISVLRDTPLVVMRKFSVSQFWGVASRFEVTHLMSIGAIPSLLLQAPASQAEREHRIGVAIGVGVPRAQHAELHQRFGFPWLEYYGMSETCVAIAMPREAADRFVGTGALGIPVPEAQVRLVNSDGDVLDREAVGELEVSGPWVPFSGYLGDPQATAAILHDGWIRTGDLMRRDDLGVYYFEGRLKEIIRRGGENIAPAQIEAVLRNHPAVVDAAVVAVPDPVRDEEVKAYVQITAEVTPEELWMYCADRLAPHKVPRYIELRVDPFPRTPSQRIRKKLLQVDGAHQIDRAWDSTSRATTAKGRPS